MCKLSAAHDPQLQFSGWRGVLILFLCMFGGMGVLSLALTAKTRTYVFLKHAAIAANARRTNCQNR